MWPIIYKIFPIIVNNDYGGHSFVIWVFCLLTIISIGKTRSTDSLNFLDKGARKCSSEWSLLCARLIDKPKLWNSLNSRKRICIQVLGYLEHRKIMSQITSLLLYWRGQVNDPPNKMYISYELVGGNENSTKEVLYFSYARGRSHRRFHSQILVLEWNPQAWRRGAH